MFDVNVFQLIIIYKENFINENLKKKSCLHSFSDK